MDSSSRWSDLKKNLLVLISQQPNLSMYDMVKMSCVCRSWSNQISAVGPPFLLLLPFHHLNMQKLSLTWMKNLRLFTVKNDNNNNGDDRSMTSSLRVSYSSSFSFCEIKEFRSTVLVGLSHEWIFLRELEKYIWIMNLYSGKRIQLYNFPIMGLNDLNIPVKKAILSRSPSPHNNYNAVAVIIYGDHQLDGLGLAYCLVVGNDHRRRVGKGNSEDNYWRNLCQENKYVDVVWDENGNILYALTQTREIITWDFSYITNNNNNNNNNTNEPPSKKKKKKKEPLPPKKLFFSPSFSFSLSMIDDGDFIPFKIMKLYLAISKKKGNIWLIHRYMYMDHDDVDCSNAFCPAKTMEFRVFEINMESREWVKVESLEDEVIFLGGNQTFCLSSEDYSGLIKKNSIYFTDSYSNNMIEKSCLHRGYDYGVGVFNLENHNFHMFVDSDEKNVPIPYWVCNF